MDNPELVFVAGCNAAGKSTFIRTRLAELTGFEILMTDVYKGRTKSLARQAITNRKSIILETVFNDESFRDIVDEANNIHYTTALVVLFLDNITQSTARVAAREIQQTGITISDNNIKINFNESFKNIAHYFFYFDRTDFIFTGRSGINKLTMSFEKGQLTYYQANDLQYPQKFASYSHDKNRLSKEAYDIITLNKDFKIDSPGNSKGTKYPL